MVRIRYRLLWILMVPFGLVAGLTFFGVFFLGRGAAVTSVYSVDEAMRIALAFCAVAVALCVVTVASGTFAIRLLDRTLTRRALLRTVVGAAGGAAGVLVVFVVVDLIFTTFFTAAHQPSIGLTTFVGIASALVAGVVGFVGFGVSELRAARAG